QAGTPGKDSGQAGRHERGKEGPRWRAGGGPRGREGRGLRNLHPSHLAIAEPAQEGRASSRERLRPRRPRGGVEQGGTGKMIEFRDVTFVHQSGKRGLRDVNLKVERAEVLVLVCAHVAGKATMVAR